MAQFSYTTTPGLRYNLKSLDDLRRDLMLVSVSPKNELRALWASRIKQMNAILSLTGYPFTKQDIVDTITSKKKPTNERAIITRLHEGLSAIRRNWLATDTPISISAVDAVVAMTFPKTIGFYQRRLRNHETSLRQLLDYVDNDSEHPLLRGSIAYIEILRIRPFDEDSTILASLLMELIFAKSGYDGRGFLTPEATWNSDKSTYTSLTTEAIKHANFTDWLNWTAQTAITTLELAKEALVKPSSTRDIRAAFFDLNERQKIILTSLEEPDRKITNKEVQKRYHVSQITASRDLTKMAQLALIYARGKGRSVYYTRV